MKTYEQQAALIARRWARRLGLGFHPDTPAADYEPALSASERREYVRDMDRLMQVRDPYAVCVQVLREDGLL